MELDKELETPFGKVRFKGEVTEDELDYIIKAGLLVMMARGQIKAVFTDEEAQEEPTFNTEGPDDWEQIH